MSEHPGGGCGGGGARERPVFPARSAGLQKAVLGVGISRRPGARASCFAVRAWCRPVSASRARTVSEPVPAAGSGRETVHGPAPDDCLAPCSRSRGRGHGNGATVTCAFTAMARIRRGCPGHPRSTGLAWRDRRWRAANASCGKPLVPTSPQSLAKIFSNHSVLAGVPLRDRTVDLLLTMDIWLAEAGECGPPLT
jgi:hypothetical protein